ncbi:pilus assembly protein PilM [Engelhardtia mirabilis]|uniref:Competence protein A n=1 Tax=Engelhardtia mirabilis TaxID=2528011 RepID=A0A518BQ23_9BACT|nr:Competence protein A [Planctomycetes bacterium Pla133]QDV03403.1 Competence protein A [Planctomycetes bacterium Pla86]
MPRTSTGVDIGHRSAVFLRGHAKGNTFVATDYAFGTHRSDDVASAWEQAAPDFKPTGARVGITGREVNLRYSRVPRLADWQLRKLMRFEVEEVGGSSDAQVAADFNVLPEMPEIEGEDVVLLAMARESLLEAHEEGLAAVGGRLDAFTPNAVALYNAWLRFGVVMDDTVLLANIGHENTDVVLVRGADLVFARNLSGGSKLFDDAIASRLNCDAARAEKIKQESVDLTPGARYLDSTAEKVSRAGLAPAGQILGLLQSTLAFAKSQVKISSLKLDRVFICGGGARLKGLDRYLSSAMSVPVAPFEPFTVVDVSKLSPEAQRALEAHELESVVALGLAHAGSDPEAYSVEIVPAALQRKREFLGRKAFLIAAAVVGLAYIGWSVVEKRAELTDLRGQISRLSTQVRSRERVNSETEQLMAENEELAAVAGELYGMAASGTQLARTLRLLDRHLPDGFWITDLTSTFATDEEFGADRGEKIPVLSIEGRAEEGVEPNTARFQRLLGALQVGFPTAVVRGGLSPDQRRFNLTLSLLAEREDDATTEPDDENVQGG